MLLGRLICNKAGHSDGFSVAASPPLQSRACWRRYVLAMKYFATILLLTSLGIPEVHALSVACRPGDVVEQRTEGLAVKLARNPEYHYVIALPKGVNEFSLDIIQVIALDERYEPVIVFSPQLKEKNDQLESSFTVYRPFPKMQVHAHYGDSCSGISILQELEN